MKPTSTAWPGTYYRPNAVTVRFVCGYGTASTSIPELMRAAIKLLISHFFENREGLNIGFANVDQIPIPNAVEQILTQLSLRDQF